MRNAAFPIDWGSYPPRSLTCVSFRFTSGRICSALCTAPFCTSTYIYVCLRMYSGSWNWRKRDEKNAETNLGTVRMEMPCRCYSHLHSDFRYKPLCPSPPGLSLFVPRFFLPFASILPPFLSLPISRLCLSLLVDRRLLSRRSWVNYRMKFNSSSVAFYISSLWFSFFFCRVGEGCTLRNTWEGCHDIKTRNVLEICSSEKP